MNKIQYIPGRSNLSVTFHIPSQCSNNCKFCVNKDFYKYGTNPNAILNFAKIVNDSQIEGVVITGGEPTNDLDFLKKLVNKLPDKKVYINTSLPKSNYKGFMAFIEDNINTVNNIQCINISRHANSYEEEFLKNIVADKEISAIPLSVRINVLVSNTTNIEAICNRWEKLHYSLSIGFRNDFTKISKSELHTIGELPDYLKHLRFIGKQECPACDTLHFERGNLLVTWHKGLRYTSNAFATYDNTSVIQVNDIVVYPDGRVCYDWDHDKVLKFKNLDLRRLYTFSRCV